MKEEKQVQNEVLETTNSVNSELVETMDLLGFIPKNDVDEIVKEQNDFVVIPDMFLERKITRKNNKEYHDYILHGMLRGVVVSLYARPAKTSTGFTDVSSYTLLNIVFGNVNQAQLAVRINRRTDRQTQRVTTSLDYVAYSKDDDGVSDLFCPLRFETAADRATLQQLLVRSNAKYNLNLPL